MRRILAPIALAALLLGSACGPTERDARAVLEEARRAGSERSYRGIQVRRFVLDGEERTATMRIHHAPRGADLRAEDILDPEGLAEKIAREDGPVARALARALGSPSVAPRQDDLAETLARDVNAVLGDRPLADATDLAGVPLPPDVADWVEAGPAPDEVARYNRRLLEAAFPDEIAPADGGTRYEGTRPGGDGTWVHYSGRGPDVPWLSDLDLVVRSYRLLVEGEDEVAGRPAVRYRLKSRMPDRPSRRFWLDRETGLLLRDEGIDAGGRTFEECAFETIEYDVEPPLPEADAGADRRPPLRRIACDRLAAEAGFEPFWPRALPEGFQLLACRLRDGDRRGAILLYGDGLARIAISQWPADGPAANADPDDEVEVRREVRGGETWLGLRLADTRIDVSSRTIRSDLLLDVVASLARGGRNGS
jgi:hypothetical protein